MEDRRVRIPSLPNEVIIEILTWLPVKSLLKFRCVCRSWRTLISSQQFVTAHLKNSKLDRNFTTHRLIMEYEGNFKQCSVNSVLYEPVSEACNLSCSVGTDYGLVVGSCNGLICVSPSADTQLILWNPSTRIRKELPDFGVNIERFISYFDYGFGFDKSSDDYKVVGLFRKNLESEVIVQVYSLRNDRWKRIKNFVNGKWEIYQSAMFVNGKLYWIAFIQNELESRRDIVSFDLEEEKDEILQMPSYANRLYCARLGASERSLYLLFHHRDGADVYIMDCCNVGKRNWTKVVTIPYFDDFVKNTHKVALYVKNDRVLLVCGVELVIFDAKDCSFRYPQVRNSVKFVAEGTYIESLVSPLGY